jgi:hypothetical protein
MSYDMTSRLARLAIGLVLLTAMVSGTVSATEAPQDSVEPVGALDGDSIDIYDHTDDNTGGYDCGPNNTYSTIVGGCVYTG